MNQHDIQLINTIEEILAIDAQAREDAKQFEIMSRGIP